MNVSRSKANVRTLLLFRSLSDPLRLRLLCLLRGGERCVCDLVEALKLAQPKISRHLAYLRKAGWVETRRDGLWVFYKLAQPRSKTHTKLLECLTACAEETSECQCDAVKLASCSNGPKRCC
jgi:ArsR family transcriptional regulator